MPDTRIGDGLKVRGNRLNGIAPVMGIAWTLLAGGIFARVVGLQLLSSAITNPSDYRWAQFWLGIAPWFLCSGFIVLIITCAAIASKWSKG